jgi:diguanylate cyclase (GGDEF)-like protein/PAS domain S-box-containing protein
MATLEAMASTWSTWPEPVLLTGGAQDGPAPVRWANAAAVRAGGRGAGSLVGLPLEDLALLGSPPVEAFEAAACGPGPRSCSGTAPAPDGRWYDALVDDLPPSPGGEGGRCWVLRDVTRWHALAEDLRRSDERWVAAFEAAGDGVWDWHPQTGEEHFSDRFLALYGFGRDEVPALAAALDDMTHPDDRARMTLDREDHFAGRTPLYLNEHRVRCRDGQWKWILSRGVVIRRDAQGRPLRVIGTHTDISARKEAESRLWAQSRHDSLTGLPNRRLLQERFEQLCRADPAASPVMALLLVDLDGFKAVNDIHGHAAGDALLQAVAQRLRGRVGPDDIVARMGGDEFAVLLTRPAGESEALDLAARLAQVLREPVRHGEVELRAGGSIGVAMWPHSGLSLSEVLRDADQALYAVKAAGRNGFRQITPDMRAESLERSRLAHALRGAQARGEFHLVYQPIVRLLDGRVMKIEVLLRWGVEPPSRFIPLAESMGLMPEIGEWVMDGVIAQRRRWQDEGRVVPRLTVNVSALQLRHDAGAVARWLDKLARAGLPPAVLGLELTESVLLDAAPAVRGQLSVARAAGMTILLDDFGTGYSALAHLQHHDIDVIKLDRAFLQGIDAVPRARALCRAVLSLAHDLGLRVVAEGVETAGQASALTALGLDQVQGHHVAAPMAAADLERWLTARACGRGPEART